jgi:hypothetical protein
MGPLQVLGMSVVERMYDGQMCLAQKFANIVWQVLFSVITSLSKQRTSDIVWQGDVLRGVDNYLPPFGRSSGCMTCVGDHDAGVWISCVLPEFL